MLQQLSIAEGGVNYSARRYNDLKVLSTRLTRELKLKLDDLDEQKKQYDRLEALRKAQTEEGKCDIISINKGRVQVLRQTVSPYDGQWGRGQNSTENLMSRPPFNGLDLIGPRSVR